MRKVKGKGKLCRTSKGRFTRCRTGVAARSLNGLEGRNPFPSAMDRIKKAGYPTTPKCGDWISFGTPDEWGKRSAWLTGYWDFKSKKCVKCKPGEYKKNSKCIALHI